MKKENLLSIDIGASEIKAMVAQVNNGQFSIAGWGSAPATGYAKGVFNEVPVVATAIRQAVDCAVMAGKITANEAQISLNSDNISTVIALGSVASQQGLFYEDDIQRAMKAAELAVIAEDQYILHAIPLQIQVDDECYDQLLHGVSGKSLKVLTSFITAPKLLISQLSTALEGQKLKVKQFSASGFAVMEALKTRLMSQEHCIIMDIGSGMISLSYYRGGPAWTANLPLGGDYIVRDLMQALNIHRNHAEQVKVIYEQIDPAAYGHDEIVDCNDYGTSDKLIQYDFLADVVESRVDELVTLTYDYIKQHLPAETNLDWQAFEQNGKIYLTGGYAKFPSFQNAIGRIFKVSVDLAAPDSVDQEYAKPENTVCCGLLRLGAQSLPIQMSGVSPWQSVTAKFKSWFNFD